MMYDVVFLNSNRPIDQFWLVRPKFGDVLNVGVFSQGVFGPGEVELWEVVDVEGSVVSVKRKGSRTEPAEPKKAVAPEYADLEIQMQDLQNRHAEIVQQMDAVREKMREMRR